MATKENTEQKQKKKFLKAPDSKSLIKWKLTPYEYIWRSIFVVVVFGGSFLVQKIIKFQNSMETAHIEKGSVYDFWISCSVAVIIAFLRYLIKKYLQDTLVHQLSQKRLKTLEDGRKRAEQLCKWLFDVIYYSLSTIAAYLILKDQKFFPPHLGGPSDGDCNLLFMEFPHVPNVPYLRIFYLVQCGTHLYTFVHQVTCKYSDPKYYEYVLHHGLALFLIVFSYLMNMILVGCVVLFLHDPCDTILILGRAYTDYKNRNTYVNVYLGVQAILGWIYLRNYVFPTCVINSCIKFYMSPKDDALADIVQGPIAYQTGMLTALACMSIYWMLFMLKGGLNLIRSGKDKNGYDS